MEIMVQREPNCLKMNFTHAARLMLQLQVRIPWLANIQIAVFADQHELPNIISPNQQP